MRIPDKSCGLSTAQNLPETVFLGLKAAVSGTIRRKIAMTNPHRSSKIRTTEPESAQHPKNPHNPSKIRTPVFWHGSHMVSLYVTQKIRDVVSRLCPNR